MFVYMAYKNMVVKTRHIENFLTLVPSVRSPAPPKSKKTAPK